MKRLAILSGLVLIGTVSLMAAQQQPQQQPAALEIVKAKENCT